MGKRKEHQAEEPPQKKRPEQHQFCCSYENCGCSYSNAYSLTTHINANHLTIRFRCPLCSKMYKNNNDMKSHYKKAHKDRHECQFCQEPFQDQNELLKFAHIRKCCRIQAVSGNQVGSGAAKPPENNGGQSKSPDPNGQVDLTNFGVRRQGENDQEKDAPGPSGFIQEHSPGRIIGQPLVPLDNEQPNLEAVEDLPEDLRDVVLQHWPQIRTNHSINDVLDHSYNFRWSSAQGRFDRMIRDIFENEPNAFRVNASIGVTLRNKETEELRYFYPSDNNYMLFDRPRTIASGEDAAQLIQDLNEIALEERFSRPDTKNVLAVINNVQFYVTPLTSFVAGCKDLVLPDSIQFRGQRSVLSLQMDKNSNQINDNLCFFRAVAYVLRNGDYSTRVAFEFYEQYCKRKGMLVDMANFEGVPYCDVQLCEKLFKVNIQLFHLAGNGASCWRHVIPKYDKTLNLDVCIIKHQKVHYSVITDLNIYAKRFICIGCKRPFKSMRLHNRHARGHCRNGESRHIFPGGIYKNKQTLFEMLEEEAEIKFENESKRCPYFVVFDFEALQNPVPLDNNNKHKICYINYHQPISVAVKSNIPDFKDTRYFVDKNPDILIQKFLKYLEEISDTQYRLLVPHYSNLFSQLQDRIDLCTQEIENFKKAEKKHTKEKGYLNLLLRLQTKLDEYCSQVTVLGFNSKKYDLNLIKKHLLPKLVNQSRLRHQRTLEEDNFEDDVSDHDDDIGTTEFLDNECEVDDNAEEEDIDIASGFSSKGDPAWPFAIMHNHACVYLSSKKLRFLDVSNYLAAGSSLDSFLGTYSTTLRKASFPYSYLDSFDRLAECSLPPKEAFFNALKQEAISDEDYSKCVQYWEENKMKTFGDYLEFYNKRDVEPFLEASETMAADFWEKFKMDIYREAISLPGVTLKYLFSNVESMKTPFSLFVDKDKEVFYDLKNSMCGGLSLVMTRYAKRGETFIRNNPDKPVKAILGWDSNALYLQSQGKSMPVGFYDVWNWAEDENKFIKRSRSKTISIEWLEYQEWLNGTRIQHLGNGTEKKIGLRRLPVDGYCSQTNTVFEFFGCWVHHHSCPLFEKENQRNPNKRDKEKARAWIVEKEAYIRNLGYNLVTIYECEWRKIRNNYITTRSLQEPNFFRRFEQVYRVSERAMRTAILNDEVFGFVKVDISTPDHLKEVYADFPPIIKHAEIGREHLGEDMRRFAEENNLLTRPRRNLISTYSGKKIVLMTPMVIFLVQHGLVLEKIYKVIQYDKGTPFRWFQDKVTTHRLKGDGFETFQELDGSTHARPIPGGKNKVSAFEADTFKLLGNTGYGKCLTNKEKHMDTFYCDYQKAVESNISPYIKSIKYIAQNCYEIQMRKKKVKWDLPIVVGLAVYCHAKIRMMEFAYDFLLKYLDPQDYQWMETDTDSAYLALSKNSLEELVRPEMKEAFEADAKNWLTDPKNPYTKRQPGLFKVEFEATAMCCLCSKTYMAYNEETGEKKVSSKGLSKRLNKMKFEDYSSVLFNRTSKAGENRGFIMRSDNRMWTYIQSRLGLSYLYIKRFVEPDGSNTRPLDI